MPPKANSQGDEKPKDEKPSQNRFIKDGWGSYHNFLLSYGLKPTPDGYEEGKLILEAFEKDGLFEKKR
ncbi:hypothetical protein HDK77DRAFT_487042 [Phyllosticta capitalensis]|uniref:Uncharacterized protein n=1 Tax=Phyllosticta capitalensis TaxID=121624 RepID=A0ABR1YPQ2_9PEZI